MPDRQDTLKYFTYRKFLFYSVLHNFNFTKLNLRRIVDKSKT